MDAWLREICTYYRYMPAAAKNAVRSFLNFDLSRPKDIYIQDQLAWGTVDGPPGGGPGGSSVLIMQRSALETLPAGDVLEVMSALDGAGGGATVSATPSRSDDRRASISGANYRPLPSSTPLRASMSFGASDLHNARWETSSHQPQGTKR